MFTALSQIAFLSSFLLSIPETFAQPNTFSGTYQSIINSGGCNGPQIGSAYITLGMCVKSVDGTSSSFFSMDISGDDDTLYESSFPNSDCSGDSTDTAVTTYTNGCAEVDGQGYTSPVVVSSADCDSTGLGDITYASSDDCGDSSKIVRCQVYENGACLFNSEADTPEYYSSTCGENQFYATYTFFDASSPLGTVCGGQPLYENGMLASTVAYYYSCWVSTSDEQAPAYAQTLTCGTTSTSSSSSSSCSNCASSDDLDKTTDLSAASVGVGVIILIFSIATMVLTVQINNKPMASSSS